MRAIGQITIKNICDVVASETAPENPYVGQLWVDLSVSPPETMVWNGVEWVVQNDLSNGESAAEIKVYSFSSGDEFFEDMLKGDNGDYISFSSRSYLLEWKSIAGIEMDRIVDLR